MGTHSRRATRWSAVIVAVAVVVPAAGGTAATRQASVLPAKLVGTWSRKVTTADVKRTGAAGITAGSVWTLVIKKNDHVSISGSAGTFAGYLHAMGATRFRTNAGIGVPAVYTWRVSGRLLTLTKVSDQTPDREAVLEGGWKRK